MIGVMLALALSNQAGACAGMAHATEAVAESTGQEAIFSLMDGGAAVEYRVRYEGNADDFGWVIPIPGRFDSLVEGDASLFDALEAATAPSVRFEEPAQKNRGLGCMGGASMGGRPSDRLMGPSSSGYAGPYGYTVVEGDSVAAVADWLQEHGWDDGGTTDALEAYVDEGGFQFVLVDLQPELIEADTRSLPPIRIAYAGKELRFPARMAQNMPNADQRTTLYTLGRTTANLEGWPVSSEHEPRGRGKRADQVWSNHLADHDGQYVYTYSGAFSGRWVTRYDTHTSSEAHEDDVWLVFDEYGDLQDLTVVVEPRDGRAALLLLPLLGWFVRRRDPI
jgi:hypothetical protein